MIFINKMTYLIEFNKLRTRVTHANTKRYMKTNITSLVMENNPKRYYIICSNYAIWIYGNIICGYK